MWMSAIVKSHIIIISKKWNRFNQNKIIMQIKCVDICSISERVKEEKSASLEESFYNLIVPCVISIVDSWNDAWQLGV